MIHFKPKFPNSISTFIFQFNLSINFIFDEYVFSFTYNYDFFRKFQYLLLFYYQIQGCQTPI